jgi:AcrR family transcriptional regulator
MLAALESFATFGYHGASTRDIAVRAGMSPAALYIRFESKAEMLREISVAGHIDLRDAMLAADVPDLDPLLRLDAIIVAFTSWHADYYQLARVMHYELESLDSEGYNAVVKIRRDIEQRLRALMAAAAGHDGPSVDLDVAMQIVMSAVIDVARWYPLERKPPPLDLGHQYAEMVRGLIAMVRAAAEQHGSSGSSLGVAQP